MGVRGPSRVALDTENLKILRSYEYGELVARLRLLIHIGSASDTSPLVCDPCELSTAFLFWFGTGAVLNQRCRISVVARADEFNK